MIVERIEEFQVQHVLGGQSGECSGGGIAIALDPAAGARDHLHPVGPQREEFARRFIER